MNCLSSRNLGFQAFCFGFLMHLLGLANLIASTGNNFIVVICNCLGQSIPDGAGSNAPAGSSCGGGAAPGCGQTLPEEAPAPPCCSGVRHFRFDTCNVKARLAVVTCLGALLRALFSLAFPGGTPGIGLAVPGQSRPFLGFARLLPKPQQNKSDGGEIWEVMEEQIRPVPPRAPLRGRAQQELTPPQQAPALAGAGLLCRTGGFAAVAALPGASLRAPSIPRGDPSRGRGGKREMEGLGVGWRGKESALLRGGN